jgi:predicted glycoside hydrolase/deacetylase ChbG (UPF0249 family)
MSPGINRGVAEAHIHGVVTSASLMVRWPSARAASDWARRQTGFSLGLHLDLGEWAYRAGAWVPWYERVSLDRSDAVAAELDGQLSAFTALVGRPPTHVDSHQHVHLREPVRGLLLERADRLGVPIRGLVGAVAYRGSFYGLHTDGTPHPDGISHDGFLAAALAQSGKVVEVACHPAAEVDFESMYEAERLDELRTLCDPRLRTALGDAGVDLVTFDDLGP